MVPVSAGPADPGQLPPAHRQPRGGVPAPALLGHRRGEAVPHQREHPRDPVQPAEADVDPRQHARDLRGGLEVPPLERVRLLHARGRARWSTTRWQTARSFSTWTPARGRRKSPASPASTFPSFRTRCRPGRGSAPSPGRSPTSWAWRGARPSWPARTTSARTRWDAASRRPGSA